MANRWAQVACSLLACVLVVAACSIATESVTITENREFLTNDEADGSAVTSAAPADPDLADGEAGEGGSGRGDRSRPIAGVDPSLVRDDRICVDDFDTGDAQDRFTYTVAYQVVDGTLGAICFGEASEVLEDSWHMLAEITPPDQLRDLAVFGGFETRGDTLAFVTTADGGLGSLFEMSINLSTASDDPDELSLTLAHEFSHVFTATPSQLDRDASSQDCETFDSGEGCYLPDSILAEWVAEFWPTHLAQFDADDNSEDNVVQRCAIDAGFFGSYGATNPEEDFAEAFAAYVMRVPADGQSQQRRLDWIDAQPGLREFQLRAIQFGYGPLASTFDECGFQSE